MDDDQKQRPDSLLPYGKWIEQALRHVVAQAVEHVAAEGLPGGHHFYLTFRTDHPGTQLPERVRAQYPKEMTIVLQHQFWDLGFNRASNAIEVGLSFGGVPARLVIPLDAVTEFADPHIRYGLRFQPTPVPAVPGSASPRAAPAVPEGTTAGTPRAATGATAGESTEDRPEPADDESGQVVSLDAFRRRSPQD